VTEWLCRLTLLSLVLALEFVAKIVSALLLIAGRGISGSKPILPTNTVSSVVKHLASNWELGERRRVS